MKNRGLKTLLSTVIAASMITGGFVLPAAAEDTADVSCEIVSETADEEKNVWVEQEAAVELLEQTEVPDEAVFASAEGENEHDGMNMEAGEDVDEFSDRMATDGKNICRIGNDTYQLLCGNIPFYTGRSHESLTSNKKAATKDLNIVVRKNGTTMNSGEYTLKYKNNKFATGFKDKSPECYIKLGKGSDKEAKKILKKTAMGFDIRAAVLGRDIDVSRTIVKYKKNLLTGERKIMKYVFYDNKGNEMKFSTGKVGKGKNIGINVLSKKGGSYEIYYEGDGRNVIGSGTASFTLF